MLGEKETKVHTKARNGEKKYSGGKVKTEQGSKQKKDRKKNKRNKIIIEKSRRKN